jgi:sugar O-acyltransferase (sialic acid O-acetyltransferase NeuD family)
MQKPVIIVGAGGHAKVLVDVLRLMGKSIFGVVDPEKEKGYKWMGVNVLGDDNAIFEYKYKDVDLVNGIGKIPSSDLRSILDNKFISKGYSFITVIHPTAIISKDSNIGDGVQIMAGCIIQPGVTIGDSSIINTGATIDHDCVINTGVHVAPGAILCGNVSVGSQTFIGANSVVIQGIEIGRGCVVGAGSVIHENIHDSRKVIQKNNEFSQCKG